MSPVNGRSTEDSLSALIDITGSMITQYAPESLSRWLIVDAWEQRLVLVRGGTAERWWPISTSAVGLDNRADSGGTPPGVHVIDRKIGAGATPGTVFVSREPTGEIWRPAEVDSGAGTSGTAGDGAAAAMSDDTADAAKDLIITRILTLRGLEPGVNQGPGVDSHERYIYIHGTNRVADIGRPTSAGCVRLTSRDVREVFDLVDEGDPVVII